MATLTLKGVKDRAQPATETQETQSTNDAPEVPAPTPELNPRNAAIAEIAKAVASKAQSESEELSQLYDDEAAKTETTADAAPDESQDDTEAAEAETAEEPAVEVAEEPQRRMVQVKINGTVREVPEDELISTYQKERSADEKFQEAARLRDEAFAAIRSQQPPPQQQGVPLDKKAIVERIQYGSAEEAAEAIEQLQSLTVQQARQETQKVLLQQEFNAFTAGNSDLVNDPVTWGALLALEEHLTASGFQGSPRQKWDEAAKQVRTRFQQPTTTATAPAKVAAAPSQSRVERKASMTVVPAAAGRMTPSTETKPKTPAEIIEAERKRRMKGRNF